MILRIYKEILKGLEFVFGDSKPFIYQLLLSIDFIFALFDKEKDKVPIIIYTIINGNTLLILQNIFIGRIIHIEDNTNPDIKSFFEALQSTP